MLKINKLAKAIQTLRGMSTELTEIADKYYHFQQFDLAEIFYHLADDADIALHDIGDLCPKCRGTGFLGEEFKLCTVCHGNQTVENAEDIKESQ